MMGFELPIVSAVIARLPSPEISLAAYGGIVFPLSLLIEAPIIMLLAASTALSRDLKTYIKLRRFMMTAGAALTGVHLLVAATPLYDFVVGTLIDAPLEIRGPARIGLLIVTPWTWSIAYRRFQQGVLIRFGRPRTVGVGTGVRLAANATVLAVGAAIGKLPGIVVGAAAISSGVLAEALFIGWRVRPIVRDELAAAPESDEPLTARNFLRFYIPLAMTSLISLLALPIGSAAISRMPRPIDSLAVWPVLGGLTFTLRSLGLAYTEVVVALFEKPGAPRALFRFTVLLASATSTTLLLIAATPLARLWFASISGLSAPLTALGSRAIWISLLVPALSVLQSWHQGILVHLRRTRGVTEAVSIYLAMSGLLLWFGVHSARFTGLYVGLAAALIGYLTQVLWLQRRSRQAREGTIRGEQSGDLRSLTIIPGRDRA
jgi:hypothetical protein